MKRYPLLFNYRDLVSGRSFLAGVSTSGRGLLVEEADGSWTMYGVYPGALAGVGDTRDAATSQFRDMYRAALYDMAETTTGFDEFEAEVRGFFHDKNEINEAEWNEAAQKIAEGETDGRDRNRPHPQHGPPTRSRRCLREEAPASASLT